MSFPVQKIIVRVLFAIFCGKAHGPLDMLAYAISTALSSLAATARAT